MKLLKRMLLASLVACSLLLVAPVVVPVISDSYTVEAASVKLNTTKKTVYVGEAFTLKLSGTKKKIKWSSTNKNVASVDSKGRVTTKKAGTVKIKAKVGNKTYSCKVTVKNYSKSKVSASIEKLDKRIVVTFKNKNSYAVRLVPTVTFYKSNGKKINKTSNFNYCLEPNSKCIMTFYCYDTKLKSKDYASFKIDMGTIKKSNYTKYGASKIEVKSTKKDSYIEAKVKNKSGKDLQFINITYLFYNKKGNLIDSEEHYADCTKKGSKDTLRYYYPYDSNYNFIKPAKYKAFVNYAYK